MYKLHLCLRYLRSRVIAYFAILCVALCVAMMLIVISVMNGFLDKIESATKGLFGDIVLDTTSLSGLGYYDEFIAQVRSAMPEKIEAASPFAQTYALLRVPHTEHRQTVTVVGIRLPKRAQVSDFENGLFVQKKWTAPTFDPPIADALKTMMEEHQRTEEVLHRVTEEMLDRLTEADDQHPTAGREDLIRQIRERQDVIGQIREEVFHRLTEADVQGLTTAQKNLIRHIRARQDLTREIREGDNLIRQIREEILDRMTEEMLHRLTEANDQHLTAGRENLIRRIREEILDLVTKEILQRLIEVNDQHPTAARENLIRQIRERRDLIGQLRVAVRFQNRDIETLRQAEPYQKQLAELQGQLDAVRAELDRTGGKSQELRTEKGKLIDRIDELEETSGLQAPERRVILGLGLPALSFRTPDGETVRVVGPGHTIVLTMIPLGKETLETASITPTTAIFSVIDDSQTDVWSIDSNVVYIPFETLQRLNNMTAVYSDEEPGRIVTPARCSQIHFKVKDPYVDRRKLKAVCTEIHEQWLQFKDRYPDASTVETTVETWWERNARIIGPIEQQRTLVVIMFAVVSLVAVVLIFVIFYMIVLQKTKDIGVLKAVGASSGGVAGIFFLYAAAIGLVGSVLGTIGGYYFVKYINVIRDASEKYLGFGVWSKEWYLFERIPNRVNPLTAVEIVVAAIFASMLGALIPAVRAARMQPVEALRYE